MEHHDDVGAARVHFSRALSNGLLITVPEMRAAIARAAELVARHGLGRLQAFYLAWGSRIAIDAGDWPAAMRLRYVVVLR